MFQWLRKHVGIEKPYSLERLLIVAWASLLAAFSVGAVALLYAAGEMSVASPRGHYFIYLGILVLLGTVLANCPRIAACILSLATVDLSLGLGSFSIEALGLARISILPDRYDDPPRFQWHPLLQAIPIPSIQRHVVYLSVGHSSESTRGRTYERNELSKKTVIATFGGSTTYDVSVSDDETWSNRLEEALGTNHYAVINHGVLGYTTVEHLIQTAFYQDTFGVAPSCAIYYIGWNDIRNAHIPKLDAGYADFHLPSQIDALKVRRFGPSYVSLSPLLTIIARLTSAEVDTIRPARP